MEYKTFSWDNPKVNPASVFEALRRGSDDVLLESTMLGQHGRFSYIGLDAGTTIRSNGNYVLVNGVFQRANPLEVLQRELGKRKTARPEGFPLFYDGAVGYLGYNLKNKIEPRLSTQAERDTNFDDMYMVFPRAIIGFDHTTKKVYLSLKEDAAITEKEVHQALNSEESATREPSKEKIDVRTNLTFEEYREIFDRAKEYVCSGDTYQVKISMRHEFNADFDPWEVYKKLRVANPSPYAAFLDLEGMALVSCSPEELVRLEGRVAETRPIGGTYRRNPQEDDAAVARSFFEDEKEVAEHAMLIDLERNDLGRVCELGTVKITEQMALEKYPNLMHIVTTIRGRLDEGRTSFDLLRSMFPGGTVTGCPKIRTMEIIDELEPVSRGPYTGSIGFVTPNDECQFNIIIRTMAIDKKNRTGYIQIGGGIVADSNAEYEYQENLRKGKALVDVLI